MALGSTNKHCALGHIINLHSGLSQRELCLHPAIINQASVSWLHQKNLFIYLPFLLESVAETEMAPSLFSVISNNKHQNLSLKSSSRSLLAKYGVKALVLFYCVFPIKINVFINSQNVLVITITEFQLMIKKQTRFGKNSRCLPYSKFIPHQQRTGANALKPNIFLWNQTS